MDKLNVRFFGLWERIETFRPKTSGTEEDVQALCFKDWINFLILYLILHCTTQRHHMCTVYEQTMKTLPHSLMFRSPCSASGDIWTPVMGRSTGKLNLTFGSVYFCLFVMWTNIWVSLPGLFIGTTTSAVLRPPIGSDPDVKAETWLQHAAC